MELLESITHLKLFSMSIDWRRSAEYILKCKGADGDVIVMWD